MDKKTYFSLLKMEKDRQTPKQCYSPLAIRLASFKNIILSFQLINNKK